MGKVEPLGGTQVAVTTEQLSVAVAVKVTLLFEHCPASALANMFVGQVMIGGTTSLTVTAKLHEMNFPDAGARFVQFTKVVPSGKKLPEEGTHVRTKSFGLHGLPAWTA